VYVSAARAFCPGATRRRRRSFAAVDCFSLTRFSRAPPAVGFSRPVGDYVVRVCRLPTPPPPPPPPQAPIGFGRQKDRRRAAHRPVVKTHYKGNEFPENTSVAAGDDDDDCAAYNNNNNNNIEVAAANEPHRSRV